MSYGQQTDEFDSHLEWKVYKYLLRHFPKQHIHLHHPLKVRPVTRHFSQARIWKPDMILATLSPEHEFFLQSIYLIIEVKGRWLLKPHAGMSFRLLLELISINSPEVLDKLIIVSQDDFQIAGLTVNGFKTAIDNAYQRLNNHNGH